MISATSLSVSHPPPNGTIIYPIDLSILGQISILGSQYTIIEISDYVKLTKKGPRLCL